MRRLAIGSAWQGGGDFAGGGADGFEGFVHDLVIVLGGNEPGAAFEDADALAEKGLGKSGAPALVRLIALIAARFGIVVSQKAAAQMVPVIGAAGGAIINTIFIGHYQDMARGHFVVRRLEKIHGSEPVRKAYEKL